MTFRDVRNTIYPVVGMTIVLLGWQLYTHNLGINRIALPISWSLLGVHRQLGHFAAGKLADISGKRFGVCAGRRDWHSIRRLRRKLPRT